MSSAIFTAKLCQTVMHIHEQSHICRQLFVGQWWPNEKERKFPSNDTNSSDDDDISINDDNSVDGDDDDGAIDASVFEKESITSDILINIHLISRFLDGEFL